MKITNEKGITIIALIITIVILLILAAVTIDIIIDGAVTEEAKGVVNKIEDHDNTMAGIKDDVRNLIRPGDAPASDEEGGGDSEPTENTAPTLSVAISSITETSATIKATGSDADGDTLNYTLVVNGTTYGPATTKSWTITGLTRNTTYPYTVTVTDGTVTVTKTGSFTTLKGNSEPVISSNYNASPTNSTTSFTIGMRATDADGDSLTYELFYSTSENGSYSSAGTVTGASGSYVSKQKTGLSTYTDYWWYITVTDGKDTVTSGKQKLKTYCSGTGYTCSGNISLCTESTTLCTTCYGNYFNQMPRYNKLFGRIS